MAVNPKTPGVYIDEISVIPASIVGVETAIPAFIGYVEKADNNGTGIPINTPVRITSLLEYENSFGKADGQSFSIVVSDDSSVTPTVRTVTVTKNAESPFKMYYNLQMYFSNGGGPCYIVPVGLYSTTPSISKSDILAGLDAIAKEDEPTLLLFPDAVSLSLSADIRDVYNAALAQCAKLQNRFVIMDVLHTAGNTVFNDSSNFRNDYVGADNLKYGAAYYPFLSSTLNFGVNEELVHVNSQLLNGVDFDSKTAPSIIFLDNIESALVTTQQGYENMVIQSVNLTTTNVGSFQTLITGAVNTINTNLATANGAFNNTMLTNPLGFAFASVTGGDFSTTNSTYLTGPQTRAAADALLAAYGNLILFLEQVQAASYTLLKGISGYAIGSLNYLKNNNPSLYNAISPQITAQLVTINPSGAMAGIYATVDAQRGVWKAPANVGVDSIVGPSINVTNSEQDDMNIDPTSGKSINAIRAFTGRGTLVWGARTLAGNDNEWRYINVRRLFTYVEVSVKNATEFVVFEPNTATTWQRVRGMIEAFLTGLWREGALAGATTKDAFFVNVGIGTTMTADDILNGRMIVEVGMAAVRPAEFIILQFMHKLQTS